jgi:hypothetical protein
MRRFLLAGVMCGAVTTAQAADMPDLPILRGSYTDGLTTSRANWQGYYIGAQGSYGSATSKVPGSLNSDMQATFVPPPNVNYDWPRWEWRTASTGAMARLPDTTRNGMTLSSASKQTTSMTDFVPEPTR